MQSLFQAFVDEFIKIAATTLKEKVDAHFSAQTKDWDAFKKHLNSPRFRNLVSKHPQADEKLKLFVQNLGKHYSSKGIPQEVIGSTGKKYSVKSYKDGTYTCDCEHYMYKGAPTNTGCKHIDQVKSNIKEAELRNELKPHQQRVVDKMKEQIGLVVAHGLGSGKTLTSIATQDQLKLPATVVVPAALKANYVKEREKHLIGDGEPIDLDSLQNVAVKSKVKSNPLLIVDEAHRARDPLGKTYKALAKNKSDKIMLLTGSPFYNHPSDVAPLVNLVSKGDTLPLRKSDFEYRYIMDKEVDPGIVNKILGVKPGTKPVVRPSKKKELKDIFSKWVDFHPSTKEHFPDVIRETVEVPMTPKQLEIYDTLMSAAPLWVSLKVKSGLPPDKKESKELNAYLTGVRQVSNTTAPYHEGEPDLPKIHRAFEELKNNLNKHKDSKAVIYSNFLAAGIKPYKKLLEKEGITYGEFTGDMKKKERDQIVRDYNEGKIKTLLLSSAGGEGLDLQGTRLIQILEPHWNDEKIKQVEGRGIRFKSHDHLPEKERNVTVQRFFAVRPKTALHKLTGMDPGWAVDQYLDKMSKDKEELNNQFRELFELTKPKKEKTAEAYVDAYQQKEKWSCSAACLKSVMDYYDVTISEEECIKRIGTKPNKGAETTQIVDAAKELGFDSYEKSLSIEEAKKLLDDGIPIICDIQSFTKKGSGHYVVLCDIDDTYCYIMDPNVEGNTRKLTVEDFVSRWHDRAMAPPHEPMIRWGVIIKKSTQDR